MLDSTWWLRWQRYTGCDKNAVATAATTGVFPSVGSDSPVENDDSDCGVGDGSRSGDDGQKIGSTIGSESAGGSGGGTEGEENSATNGDGDNPERTSSGGDGGGGGGDSGSHVGVVAGAPSDSGGGTPAVIPETEHIKGDQVAITEETAFRNGGETFEDTATGAVAAPTIADNDYGHDTPLPTPTADGATTAAAAAGATSDGATSTANSDLFVAPCPGSGYPDAKGVDNFGGTGKFGSTSSTSCSSMLLPDTEDGTTVVAAKDEELSPSLPPTLVPEEGGGDGDGCGERRNQAAAAARNIVDGDGAVGLAKDEGTRRDKAKQVELCGDRAESADNSGGSNGSGDSGSGSGAEDHCDESADTASEGREEEQSTEQEKNILQASGPGVAIADTADAVAAAVVAERHPYPGPIDNSALVFEEKAPGTVIGSGRRLRLRLVRGYHFVLVPQEAWHALHAW